MHASYVCDYRPLKQELHRNRSTVGDDRLAYDQDDGVPAVNLLETKIILNSFISDANKGARFMPANIKDHFLVTPMQKLECVRVKN